MLRDVRRVPALSDAFDASRIDVVEAAYRLLRFPAIADKTFLITIGDRTVGGMISRDPMVGPWQVPVSDVAVTLSDYTSQTGEAMAMGERTPLALLDAPASGRMAVAEALTNIAAADIGAISDVRLSANWMAACGEPGEDADLYATVQAVGEEFCPALGITIPVGKDSLSMKTSWHGERSYAEDGRAAVADHFGIRAGARCSSHADAAAAHRSRRDCARADRSGRRSQPARRFVPGAGVRQPRPRSARLRRSGAARRLLRCDRASCAPAGLVLAYHDRSDGGLFATVAEMAFAGRCGVELDLAADAGSIAAALFSEELGAVLQIRANDAQAVRQVLERHGLARFTSVIGRVTNADRVIVRAGGKVVLDEARTALRRAWSETSFRMVELRDNPECAREQFAAALEPDDPGLQCPADVRAATGHRGAVHRQGRAAEGRDPARAGRQQSRRDGGGVPSRRLHRVRRAHDRSVRASPEPR